MAQVTTKEVQHIARLAKIKLSDKELADFTEQFDTILSYFNLLKEVDTSHVTETSQVTGLTHITRPDTPTKSQSTDKLLDCSIFPIENHSIVIPKVM